MNKNPSPQAVPGPAPLPAPDLGSCVQGIRQSILDWTESRPILGRLADPITIHILALLQTLADLFALFAAGQLAPGASPPRSVAVEPCSLPCPSAAEPASARVRNAARHPNCARRTVTPSPQSGPPRAPARPPRRVPPRRALEPATAGLIPSRHLRCGPRHPQGPSVLEKSLPTSSPTHAYFVPISK